MFIQHSYNKVRIEQFACFFWKKLPVMTLMSKVVMLIIFVWEKWSSTQVLSDKIR